MIHKLGTITTGDRGLVILPLMHNVDRPAMMYLPESGALCHVMTLDGMALSLIHI